MPDVKDRAEKAADKKATFGEDIDLSSYKDEAPEYAREDLGDISEVDKESLLYAGIDITGKNRSGSFVQVDHSVVYSGSEQEGLEIMPMTDALEKYDWLSEYWWKAVDVDTDKYTAQAELKFTNGYFIRVLPGVKTTFPLQACLYMKYKGIAQNVHNIIIAEEDSELHIITGCSTAPHIGRALHVGVSEFYVKKNAHITFSMIHSWEEEVSVRPRTGTIVGENGVFLSNYVCLSPVKTLQMYPAAKLVGEGATARYSSVLVAPEGTNLDVGAKVFLKSKGSRAEIISRALSYGGTIVARGLLAGETEGIKGHLECRGLLLDPKGQIYAVPELFGKVAGVDLSHEAAVGKIAQEEIEYLMARGLNEEEAVATIVRGFLHVKIEGLPDVLQEQLDQAIATSEETLM